MKKEEVSFNDVWKKHKNLIGDTNVKKSKRIILIAGVPGSGKTTLLKEVQNRLNYLYIRSDDLRNILIKEFHCSIAFANNTDFKDGYFEYIFEKYLQYFPNQSIIFDRSLDRGMEKVLHIVNKYGYKKYIVSVNCREDVLRERISLREGDYRDEYFKNFPQWVKDHDEFNESGVADLYLKSDELNNEDMADRVINLIER